MNEPKDYEYLLLCDGSTISEENYPELVAVLGGTQLPNLIDRFLQGSATAGTYKAAGLPNITGYASNGNGTHGENWIGNWQSSNGAFFGATYKENEGIYITSATRNKAYTRVGFDASNSNSIYGASDTVQPAAFTTKIYICYAG